jgi:hypothetical protein
VAEIYPVGGSGGMLRKDPVAGVQKIIAVLVSAGILIDMLQLIVSKNGNPQALVQHGGDGGHLTPFVLDNNEYLTGITGRYSLYVNSITLHTNMRASQRFGGDAGEREFTIKASTNEQIVGLWCRSDIYIDAIGVTTAPIGHYQKIGTIDF